MFQELAVFYVNYNFSQLNELLVNTFMVIMTPTVSKELKPFTYIDMSVHANYYATNNSHTNCVEVMFWIYTTVIRPIL